MMTASICLSAGADGLLLAPFQLLEFEDFEALGSWGDVWASANLHD